MCIYLTAFKKLSNIYNNKKREADFQKLASLFLFRPKIIYER